MDDVLVFLFTCSDSGEDAEIAAGLGTRAGAVVGSDDDAEQVAGFSMVAGAAIASGMGTTIVAWMATDSDEGSCSSLSASSE